MRNTGSLDIKCLPAIYIIHDILRALLPMSDFKIHSNPFNEVILERALNDLV